MLDSLAQPQTFGLLSTLHRYSAGGRLAARTALTATPASTAWATANQAVYIPLDLPRQVVIDRLFAQFGATTNGNYDIAIYDRSTRKRLASKGAGASPAANTFDITSISPLLLLPGSYWLALALDSATSTTYALTGLANVLTTDLIGLLSESSAYPLPATATPASMSSYFNVPVCGAIAQGAY